jgi:glutaconate CoA-transferase, subunit A
VRTPWGAHPFASRGFYLEDHHHVRAYLDAATSGDAAALGRFVDEHCRKPATHAEYLDHIGMARLLALEES